LTIPFLARTRVAGQLLKADAALARIDLQAGTVLDGGGLKPASTTGLAHEALRREVSGRVVPADLLNLLKSPSLH
jgi:hypothetical protein